MKAVRGACCLTFLLTFFAFTSTTSVAQAAHFSGVIRTPGSAATAALSGVNDTQATNGNFGSVKVGATSASPIALVFTFDASVTVGSTAVVTQGAPNLDFTSAGGTCKANTAYNTGNTCTVKVTFKPKAPGTRYGAAELLDASGDPLATGYVQGTGVGPLVTFANSSSGNYLPSSQITLGSGFSFLHGVAVDASGNVFVADNGNSAVKEIAADGGYTTVNTLGSGFSYPGGVAVDGSGNVFVADTYNSAVKEIVAAGGYATVKTLGSGFSCPWGVAVDGSGNVFVADGCSRTVKEIVAAGGYTTVNVLGSFGFLTGFFPISVAVDGDGNVFIANWGSDGLGTWEIFATGGYTTVKKLLSGADYAVAVDGSGNVFVADDDNHVVKEIVAAGGYTTVHDLGGGYILNGVAVDGSGNVFVSEGGTANLVAKLDFADPPSLSFAKTSVGVESNDSPLTVTVSNNGDAALTFPIPAAGRNPSISSAFTLDSATTCPDLGIRATAGTLAAGTSCDYAVDFIPAALGIHSGSLTLTDNSLNANPAVTQTISLAGTGIGPHLAFSTPPPASLALGYGPGTVAVSVEDSSNGVVTTSTATVRLTVTGPNSYFRAYTATASGGVATFSSLASLSTVGSYTYTALDNADGFTQAVATESVSAPPPVGGVGNVVDSVTYSSTVGQSDSVMVKGWVADPTDGSPMSNVTVYIDGNPVGTPTLGLARPDIAAAYNNSAYLKSGFRLLYPAASLSIGTHKLAVVAIDSYGQSLTLGPRKFTVAATAGVGAPFGGIDVAGDSVTAKPTISQSGTLKVSGWIVDSTDGAPLGNVKVYVDGVSIGRPTLGISRPDIATALGNNAYLHSGFRMLYSASSLALGTHQVTVVAIDSGGRSTTFGPRTITVQ